MNNEWKKWKCFYNKLYDYWDIKNTETNITLEFCNSKGSDTWYKNNNENNDPLLDGSLIENAEELTNILNEGFAVLSKGYDGNIFYEPSGHELTITRLQELLDIEKEYLNKLY